MESNDRLLVGLGTLEERLHNNLLMIPEAAMRRAEALRRGPQADSDFIEWDNFCDSLEQEVNGLLDQLDKNLGALKWKGHQMPSPFYTGLWTSWWRAVKKKARKHHFVGIQAASKHKNSAKSFRPEV